MKSSTHNNHTIQSSQLSASEKHEGFQPSQNAQNHTTKVSQNPPKLLPNDDQYLSPQMEEIYDQLVPESRKEVQRQQLPVKQHRQNDFA